jgi:superfamily II DNA/RNA helicase
VPARGGQPSDFFHSELPVFRLDRRRFVLSGRHQELHILQFDDLGLRPELLRAVREQNYTTPTPVQAQSIPAILEGRDIMAAAQTGTGKTAGWRRKP